jgi:AraC-like DNA-binding protein
MWHTGVYRASGYGTPGFRRGSQESSTIYDSQMLRRAPRPWLRPFVELLWSHDEAGDVPPVPVREHVLPTGRMHLVLRLDDDPLRLFDADSDAAGRVVGTAVVGGARDAFYVREVARPLRSVGATLLPGVARALFGVPAGDLAATHTALESLWPARDVDRLRARLSEATSHDARLALFETALVARLPRVHAMHPAVAQALVDLRAAASIDQVVRRSGYSHRGFLTLFTGAVGLTPRRYVRVRRFHRALCEAAAGRPWAELAAALGYSDQAHFTREFRGFAGVTPSAWRAAAPRHLHHLRIGSRQGVPGCRRDAVPECQGAGVR